MNNKMDIIISLVGYNSIPNYAAILNYCKSNSKIFLVCSSEGAGKSTEQVSNNLKEVVKKRYPNLNIEIINSSKSNLRNISKEFNKLKLKIVEIVSNKKEEKTEILLDITGSTKVNSAIGYSILNNELENNHGVRFYSCYVSNEEEKIYQNGYKNAKYLLEDLANNLSVTKEEILNLYGYEEYKKSNQNLNIVKDIYIKNFNLIFHIVSNNCKIAKIKNDMFVSLDIAEKLGGNLSKIFFEANSFNFDNNEEVFDEETGQEYFINILENGTNRSYKNKITLRSQINGFCNNEMMEEFISEEQRGKRK